jgi:hypothetical protein
MAGWLTNGVQAVQALVQNGVTASPVPLTNLPANTALLPADTAGVAGLQPISVAASAFQVAAAGLAMIYNTATSTVHTTTQNVAAGSFLTEALTTAVGATYTYQLVNSGIVSAATPAPQVQVRGGTNTAGSPRIDSITNAAGTCTIVISNQGTAAFNGTLLGAFHL